MIIKIVLKQNTASLFDKKNYEVFLDRKVIYMIEKSIFPFNSKDNIRDAKHKIKIGEFEGSPLDSEYGALIKARRLRREGLRSKLSKLIVEHINPYG